MKQGPPEGKVKETYVELHVNVTHSQERGIGNTCKESEEKKQKEVESGYFFNSQYKNITYTL